MFHQVSPGTCEQAGTESVARWWLGIHGGPVLDLIELVSLAGQVASGPSAPEPEQAQQVAVNLQVGTGVR